MTVKDKLADRVIGSKEELTANRPGEMRQMMHDHGGNEGFSILAALVAMSVLTIAVTIAGTTFKNEIAARKKIAASSSGLDLEQAVKASLSESFRDFIASQCNAAKLPSISEMHVSTGTVLAVTDALAIGAQMPTDILAGAARCNDPIINKNPDQAGTNFFRCYNVKFNRDFAAAAEKGTTASGEGSFVEVYGEIKDFQTGEQQKCSAMGAGLGNHGVILYYQIHWAFRNGSEKAYTTKSGAFNVAL